MFFIYQGTLTRVEAVLLHPLLDIEVFWVIIPCSLVEDYRSFRGTYCLLLQALFYLKMGAVGYVPLLFPSTQFVVQT
jgi:hypothetical protein